MKSTALTHPGVITLMALAALCIAVYKPGYKKTQFRPASHYSSYITAFTGGEVARKSSIIVRFVDEMVKPASVNARMYEYDSPFRFSPSIYGTTRWIDTRTIEFDPYNLLTSDEVYDGTLDLSGIIPAIQDSLKHFHFKFKTKKQFYKVETANPAVIDPAKPQWYKIEGTLKAADEITRDVANGMISAVKDGNERRIHWDQTEEGKEFKFTIDSLLRTREPYNITLTWNDPSFKGKKTMTIPALGNFMLVNATAKSYPDQSILLEFSDAIKKDQTLDGLIRLGNSDLRTDIEDNKIYIYPQQRLTGNVEIVLEAGIENIHGHKLPETSSTVFFEDIYPQLKEAGKGTIIPQSGILPFVFEAVNLSAVDVRIIKITEKNIPQFLQINRLEESGELKRVGTPLSTKKIMLGKDRNMDLRKWNKHVIDLSKLIKSEPGAIYQVAIGFRKSYSLYTCSDSTAADIDEMLKLSENWDEPGYDYESDYGFNRWEYYQYEENYDDTENPCKRSYYHAGRAIVRNVLASNLGLVAKRGSEGSMFVAVTDLLSAAPLSGVHVEIYDYQQQLLASGKTQNGIVTVNFQKKPFLLIAKYGTQRGYLRVDNGSSLSLSRFDIGGKEYHKGLKGFIYGERDVWRPGDSLFLNFVLEDKLKTLPSGHPVVFEMYNPQQELVQRMVRSTALDHHYAFHTCTSEDAPTGNYTIKVHAGGATFEKTVKIETIIPNRLKIHFDWDTKEIKGTSRHLKGILAAKWLHGARAQNLKADVSMTVTEAATAFKNYPEYTFTDLTRRFDPERKEIFKGILNEKGTAEVEAAISVEGVAPGMLKASFKTKVFEPGGNFSSDYCSIPFHPYDTYVGVSIPGESRTSKMLSPEQDQIMKIITLDTEGKPVPGKKVMVELYEMSWKWWWDLGEDEAYSYNGKMYSEPIQTDTLVTKAGETPWKLRMKARHRGRYMIRVCEEGGHCASRYFYIGWSGERPGDNPGGAKMLTFSTDKEVYTTGETIILNIPTGFAGKALLSLESGTKVIKSYWIEARKGMTEFKFPATPDMAPNVYAHITLIQPHAQTQNDLPIRMYGILPIRVEHPASHLYPVITMADQFRPEQQSSVHIREKNGRAMTYTIAIVDEGLLDLTRYRTPDIWASFNERQALDVKTWDVFDDVAGAHAFRMKNLLSIGGDGNRGPIDGVKANRFKPVVIFLGPFHTSGEGNTHHFRIPNYIGSVKVMVIAAYNNAYGKTEKVIPVKKPLMVLGTLPRVLGPGEELNFPVTLFAMENHVKNVSVKIETDKMVDIKGATVNEIAFTEPGEKMVYFPVKISKAPGRTHIKVIARSGKETAVYETDIDIRNPNPAVENVYESVVEAGKTWKQEIHPPGIKGTNKTILEVSSIPPLNLGKRLGYLIQYPYGCVEQTTSSVFPQVCLNQLLDLPKERRQEIDRNIRAGIQKLKSFQKHDGSLSYWPNAYETNEWGTCYAGHFMLEAELAGYTLPYGFKDKWKEYIRITSRNYSEGDELTQAYRLYLMALSGSPELGAMNRMRMGKMHSVPALWHLAAAYHLAGQPEVAGQMTHNTAMDIKNYRELSNTFGSDERDKAIILQALSIMNEHTKASSLMMDLSKKLNSADYLNTQETAYILIAIAKFTRKYNLSSNLKFAYKINEGSWKEVRSYRPLREERFKSDEQYNAAIRNTGTGLLFVKLVTTGIPEEGDKTDATSHLTLDIQYKSMDGKPIDPASITQGTDFMAEVTVVNPGARGNYEQMSLTQIFPSGWEIHNIRMSGEILKHASQPDYQDFRDDRVNTFYDLSAHQKKTFIILLNASYEGKFYLPTVYAEAMYDNSISARRHGQWVEVVKNKSIQ